VKGPSRPPSGTPVTARYTLRAWVWETGERFHANGSASLAWVRRELAWRLANGQGAKWRFRRVRPGSVVLLAPGLDPIDHGLTPAN
jgi:hypothetical protein